MCVVKGEGHKYDLEKSMVKVMATVKPIGHIWGLEINQCFCLFFRGKLTIFGWDIANSIFDLENWRSGHWELISIVFDYHFTHNMQTTFILSTDAYINH